jgi:hypothetical protein
VTNAKKIPEIRKRLEAVSSFRLNSRASTTQQYAIYPNRFRQIAYKETTSIIVPGVSSERREYVPADFLDDDTVVTNLANVIYYAEPYLFGLISSALHLAWMRVTCGRLKNDYRYSAAICYNNFPIPDLTEEQKRTITTHVFAVLNEREKHSEKTMAQLYDPDKMPDGLRQAHHNLDLAVDRLYRPQPFASDEERLEHLFKLYEEMTAKERTR